MRLKDKKNYDITEGVIWKQVLIFFFPILFGTFFQQLYNTTDAVIVGRFIGKEALSAVGGSSGTLINLLIGFFVGLSSGATVIIAQYCGAKKYEDLSDSVHTGIALGITGGAILTIVGILVAPWALKAMNTPAEVVESSLLYLRIYFLGTIPNMIYNIGAGILRAVGDSKRPLYFLIVSCFINIILDVLLVVVFKLGIIGVAIATTLSQLVSAILVITVLVKTDHVYKLHIRDIKFHFGKLNQIVSIGLPAGIQETMYSLANIIIQTSINSFGTDTVAAWTAFSKFDGIFWMVMGAFGVSITTFVGQNYGAKKIERVKSGVKQCFYLCMGATILISVILYFLGETAYLLFTTDAAVIERGMEIIRVIVPTYFTFVCVEVFSSALRAMGKSFVPMLLTCLGICGIRVLWIFTAVPLIPGLKTVMLCYPLSWGTTSIFFIIYYIYFWKKHKNIVSL